MARVPKKKDWGTFGPPQSMVRDTRVSLKVDDTKWRKLSASKPLVEIEEDSDIWSPETFRIDVTGAYVKLKPPENATDEQIVRTVEALKKWGAGLVHVLPRKRSDVVPRAAVPGVKRAHKALRETVIAIAIESNQANNAEFMPLVEKTLSEVGL